MHIVVLGAGVVGAETAYYLAQDDHSVTVVERGIYWHQAATAPMRAW